MLSRPEPFAGNAFLRYDWRPPALKRALHADPAAAGIRYVINEKTRHRAMLCGSPATESLGVIWTVRVSAIRYG